MNQKNIKYNNLFMMLNNMEGFLSRSAFVLKNYFFNDLTNVVEKKPLVLISDPSQGYELVAPNRYFELIKVERHLLFYYRQVVIALSKSGHHCMSLFNREGYTNV